MIKIKVLMNFFFGCLIVCSLINNPTIGIILSVNLEFTNTLRTKRIRKLNQIIIIVVIRMVESDPFEIFEFL